ncbi:hypothetical protein D0Z00_003182 [Geotrichum galactomycetum]|uniref:Uncharacterized protein n=1 Tax=Geotrichum galactomycetum TaxID=27317 RepID=A0ACB6V295_9ASCO|nr:hypothetical protein D0Z00_003182 [Geotrichum candidum]
MCDNSADSLDFLDVPDLENDDGDMDEDQNSAQGSSETADAVADSINSAFGPLPLSVDYVVKSPSSNEDIIFDYLNPIDSSAATEVPDYSQLFKDDTSELINFPTSHSISLQLDTIPEEIPIDVSPQATLQQNISKASEEFDFIAKPSESISESAISSASVSSASSSSLHPSETLTEEERKARNRRYAKKSRDRKTRRYQDALTLNKDLESQIAALQEENNLLRSRNTKMDAELRGYKSRLEQALQRIELASSLTRRTR